MTDTTLPLTANHWGTYRVRSEGGKAIEMLDFERDPDPSPIGPGILDIQDGPTRITQPMIRESWLMHGPGSRSDLRGQEPFVAVSWDEANKLVADDLKRVTRDHGNNAIFAGCYGWASAGRFHHAPSQLKRFLNTVGGFTNSFGTYSFAAAEAMVPHILGSYREYLATATSWESMTGTCDLFVAFGGVPVKNGQIESGALGEHIQKRGLRAAHAAGTQFVNIGPLRSDMMDELGAEWLAPRPGTDPAILLAIAHTLIVEGLHDEAALDKYTSGYEKFAAYVMGKTDGTPKDADWAAPITELSSDTIRDLARRMASNRTMISVAWSLTRQDHGEQTFWAAITVAAMLGQIGTAGGGVGFGYSAENSIGHHLTPLAGGSLPQGDKPVTDFIPVARITEMLENPGRTFEFDGRTLTYPDTRMIWWAGGNPFHHHQDLNRMLRAWQKPETIITNEWCWTAMARHSDIVLPATTPLERNDLAMTQRDPYIIAMSKVSEAPGEARNDYDIFAGIAREMGTVEAFTEGRDEADWLRWIYDVTRQQADVELPTLDQLREDGYFYYPPPETPTAMLSDFRADPEAHALSTPSGKIEIFSEVVDGFGYDDCPGHAVWREPVEWLGNADTYPLHLISNQPKDKLHSQFDHGAVSRKGKIKGREPVMLHPDDAAARGLSDGDIVRVFNDRGACLGAVIVSDTIRRDVVQMSTGAWYDPAEPGGLCKHGNPNVLTLDKGTSRLGQGPIAHSCLVEVEKLKGEAPEVTAFVPPVIKQRAELLD
jgi:biotin/methionine sulfoxide reductase